MSVQETIDKFCECGKPRGNGRRCAWCGVPYTDDSAVAQADFDEQEMWAKLRGEK